MKKKRIACWGKQIPLRYSSANDVRDLHYFWKEDRYNQRTLFFIMPIAVCLKFWKRYKFNPYVTNIEDRLWQKNIKIKL